MPSGFIPRLLGRLAVVSIIFTLTGATLATAAERAFIVSAVKVRGIDRIDKGTVLSSVPVRAGERFEPARDTGRVIRTLYDTGLFHDVSLARNGEELIVTVAERASIVEVEITGNDVIPDDKMEETMRSVGLARGRIFRRSVLDNLETEVRKVYFSRGQYGTRVTSSVEELADNRVNVNIKVKEGAVAKISHVSVIGNSAFDDKTLLGLLNSGVKGLNPFSKRDEYSKAKLAADTEQLRAWYLDRGYLRFDIVSTQVTISPDKQDINVAINIDEGAQYRVGEITLSGDKLDMADNELMAFVAFVEGDTYSRKLLTRSTSAIIERLGEDGYAFADINVFPSVNEDDHTVDLNLKVSPGRRIYVRRITFSGQENTHDEVLRREMRQMEGSRFSPQALNRSQTRLQRLPYIEQVSITTPRVLGSDDLVDIVVDVAEGPSGSFGAGAGYGTDGFVFNINLTQENLFGTGERLAIALDNSTSQDNFSISYTDPYYTNDGISRNIRGFIKNTDTSKLRSTADYIIDSYGAKVYFGVPISEYSSFNFGLGYEHVEAIETTETSPEVGEFIDNHGSEYDLFDISLGFTHDTRNRTVFATRGAKNTLNLELTTPNSDLSYLKLGYNFEYFYALTDRYTLSFSTRINYGEGEDGLDELPFFRRFFAGGIQSVRGYNTNSLGPREEIVDDEGVVTIGDAIGGDFRTLGTFELIFPPPFVEAAGATRLSVFTDFGNVFRDVSEFDADDLRGSYGIAFVWLAPIGPLTFSYAKTFNTSTSDSINNFQFTIGSIF